MATQTGAEDEDDAASELERLRARVAELETLAERDPLVPLPNRRVFVREVDRVARAFDRYGTPAAILFVDLDGLKAINDQHGHLTGDAALMHVATTLLREIRATDLVARIGGDEFGLVLDHVSEADAHAKATALREVVSREWLDVDGHRLHVSISVGATAVRAGDSFEAALRRADAAMYFNRLAQRSDR